MGAHESTISNGDKIKLLTNALQLQKKKLQYFDKKFINNNYNAKNLTTTTNNFNYKNIKNISEIDDNNNTPQRQKPSRRQYTTTIFLLRPPRDLLFSICNKQTFEKGDKLNGEIFIDVTNNNNNNSNQLCEIYNINDEKNSIKSLKIFNNNIKQNITEIKNDNRTFDLNNNQFDVLDEYEKEKKECNEQKNYSNLSYSNEQIVSSTATVTTPFSSNNYNNNKENQKNKININNRDLMVSSDESTVSYTSNENNQFTVTYNSNILSNNLTDLNNSNQEKYYQKTQFFDQLIKNFSKVAVKRRRRASVNDENENNHFGSSQTSSSYYQNYLKFCVPTLIPSPKSIISSPFRGLRRAASTSVSSISCCSAPLSQSALAILSGSGVSSTNTFSYPYPRSHTPLMVLPSRSGSTLILQPQNSISANSSNYGSRDWSKTSFSINDEFYDGCNTNINNNYNNYIETNINNSDNTLKHINLDNNFYNENNNKSFIAVGNEEPQNVYNFIENKTRPPLNRAIPPIPESKSNESIISSQLAHALLISSLTNTVDTKQTNYDNCVVIENKMAQNLATQTATNINESTATHHRTNAHNESNQLSKLTKKKNKNDSSPKSPLMSVANLMKNRITKISHKLGRNEINDNEIVNIRMSKSLLTMRRDNSSTEFNDKINNKTSYIPSIISKKKKMSKSISLEESSTKKSKLFLSKNLEAPKRPSIELVGGASTSGWYVSNNEAIPRRLPSTTLIPSSVGLKTLPTRLPLDDLPLSILKNSNDLTNGKLLNKTGIDETNNEKIKHSNENILNDYSTNDDNDSNKLNGDYFNVNNRDLNNNNIIMAQFTMKQVHFDIANSPKKKTIELLTPILSKSKELEFIRLQKIQKPNETISLIDEFSLQNNSNLINNNTKIEFVLSKQQHQQHESQSTTSDLFCVPTEMRKSTQSFPPMSKTLSPLHERKRQAPRSLSIGASDCARNSLKLKLNKSVKSYDEKCIDNIYKVEKSNSNNKLSKNESFPSSNKSKGLFSTRSFRFAASKLAEASPRLGRHIKQNEENSATTPNEPISDQKKNQETNRNHSRERRVIKFCKSASLPEEKIRKKDEKKKLKKSDKLSRSTHSLTNERDYNGNKKKENNKEKKRSNSELRKLYKKQAPLAEIESSRVAENSPAAEIPPINFENNKKNEIIVPRKNNHRFIMPFKSEKNKKSVNLKEKTTNNKNKTTTTKTTTTTKENLNDETNLLKNEFELENKTNFEVLTNKNNVYNEKSDSNNSLILTNILFAKTDGKPPPPPSSEPPPFTSTLPANKSIAATLQIGIYNNHICTDIPNLQQSTLLKNNDLQSLTSSEIALIDDSSIASSLSSPTIPIVKSNSKLTQSIVEPPSKIAKWNFTKSTTSSGIKQRQKERSNNPNLNNNNNKSGKNFSNETDKQSIKSQNSSNNNNFQLITNASASSLAMIENRMEQLKLNEKIKESSTSHSSKFRTFTSQQQQQNKNLNQQKVKNTSLKNVSVKSTQSDPINETEGNLFNEEIKSIGDFNLASNAPFHLSEFLADFKNQLISLQNALAKDYEEIEQLKHQNADLKKELSIRDQIIESLRLQVLANELIKK